MSAPAKVFHHRFFLQGPAGRLEALLWTSPQPEPRFAALVCHPHPLFGGTMHNKVVFRVARVLLDLGFPVFRFNFRGTGQSAGQHSSGRGEPDDVRAALDYLTEQFPGRPLLLAGFSFGAWVGLRAGCGDTRVAELVGLGLPANTANLSFLPACAKPLLIIQGERDPFGAREKVEALVAEMHQAHPGQAELAVVPGADHFFAGKLDQVDAALRAWLKQRHPELTAATTE